MKSSEVMTKLEICAKDRHPLVRCILAWLESECKECYVFMFIIHVRIMFMCVTVCVKWVIVNSFWNASH